MKRSLTPSRTFVPLLLGLSVGVVAVPTAYAAAFKVTSLADRGAGTLRQAMTDANTAARADTIRFGVSGTVTLASTLPPITDVSRNRCFAVSDASDDCQWQRRWRRLKQQRYY